MKPLTIILLYITLTILVIFLTSCTYHKGYWQLISCGHLSHCYNERTFSTKETCEEMAKLNNSNIDRNWVCEQIN